MKLKLRDRDRNLVLQCRRETPTPDQAMAVQDLFALGCQLYREGHRDPGWKACHTALRACGVGDDDAMRGLFDRFPGNEAELALLVGPHEEIEAYITRAHPDRRPPVAG